MPRGVYTVVSVTDYVRIMIVSKNSVSIHFSLYYAITVTLLGISDT